MCNDPSEVADWLNVCIMAEACDSTYLLTQNSVDVLNAILAGKLDPSELAVIATGGCNIKAEMTITYAFGDDSSVRVCYTIANGWHAAVAMVRIGDVYSSWDHLRSTPADTVVTATCTHYRITSITLREVYNSIRPYVALAGVSRFTPEASRIIASITSRFQRRAELGRDDDYAAETANHEEAIND